MGDVVVGRITEVGNKRWKVDVNGRQEAVLPLGSINLPGGAQRRRTMEDRLQMRQLFAENDVISCEIASLKGPNGVMHVQTRSMKYGKLENGQMVTVPNSLVKRVKSHFVTLRCGVDAVLGHNGCIWLTSSSAGKAAKDNDEDDGDKDDDDDAEEEEESQHEEDESEMNIADVEKSRVVHEMEALRHAHAKRVITPEERFRIARVANSITLLSDALLPIMPKSINIVYDVSLKFAVKPSDMLIPDIALKIIQAAKEKL